MAIHPFVLHNGAIRTSTEALLRPGQLGLLSGWGIFTTLRIDAGVPFAWERHWNRLSRDAELLNVALPRDPDRIRRDLLRLIEANGVSDATLRLVFVRNGGGMWEGPQTGIAADVIALTAESNKWGESVRLVYQPEARHSQSDFSRAKILSWAENLRWYERAHDQGFDECVLLNERGEVTECTSANIFAVFGNGVVTAPLSAGCLPGITREILIEAIHVPGISIAEKTILPEELEVADEVFITSTTRDLLPVTSIGDIPLKQGTVGKQLLKAFHEFAAAYQATNAAPAALSR